MVHDGAGGGSLPVCSGSCWCLWLGGTRVAGCQRRCWFPAHCCRASAAPVVAVLFPREAGALPWEVSSLGWTWPGWAVALPRALFHQHPVCAGRVTQAGVLRAAGTSLSPTPRVTGYRSYPHTHSGAPSLLVAWGTGQPFGVGIPSCRGGGSWFWGAAALRFPSRGAVLAGHSLQQINLPRGFAAR